MSIPTINSGDPFSSGTTKASVIMDAIIDAINTGIPSTYLKQPSAVSGSLEALGLQLVVGADPNGVTDAFTPLQAGINLSITKGLKCWLTYGQYKTSAGLSAQSNYFQMDLNGATITASANGFDVLTVGPGAGLPQAVRPNGYVQNGFLSGHGRLSDGTCCLKISGAIQYVVRDVTADNQDIGFDLINNCYGSSFHNLRGGFGGTLNVGLNLRTGSVSGSDITTHNAWINGRVAGVSISPNGGGYHFFGGQITGGQGTASATDTSAAVILGKDYLSGAVGECDADFHGTSFEGTSFAWIFRAFDQVSLKCFGCSFDPANGSQPAIGVYKNSNAKNSVVTVVGSDLGGTFSGANLVVVSGAYRTIWWYELATYTAANNPTINGSQQYVDSMAKQSGILLNSIAADGYGLSVTGNNVGPSLLVDNLTRSNSTTGLGFSSSGAYWDNLIGNKLGISSNKAYLVTTGTRSLAVASSGKIAGASNLTLDANNVILVTNSAIIMAVSVVNATNYLAVIITPTTTTALKVVAGTATTSSMGSGPGTGTYRLDAILTAGVLTAQKNGGSLGSSYTLTQTELDALALGTGQVGIGFDSGDPGTTTIASIAVI